MVQVANQLSLLKGNACFKNFFKRHQQPLKIWDDILGMYLFKKKARPAIQRRLMNSRNFDPCLT